MPFHQWEQSGGEGHVPQVIGGPLQFISLAADQARWRHHPSVVDQQIQAAVATVNGSAAALHAGEIRQVEIHQVEGTFAVHLQELLPRGFRLARAAAITTVAPF